MPVLQEFLTHAIRVLDFIPEDQHALIRGRKYSQSASVTDGIDEAIATADIQAGEERNAVVLFDPGTYRIARTLTVKAGVSLIGTGSEEKGAMLSFSADLDSGLELEGGRIRIENLHFKGEEKVRHLIRAVAVSHVGVRYCYFDSPRQDGPSAAAIFGDSTLHLKIEHNHFAVTNARSIDLLESNTAGGAGYGTNVSWIQHNTFGNCQQALIATNGDVTIRANSFDSPLAGESGDDGVAILLGDKSQGPVRIRDNYFELSQEKTAKGPICAVRVVGALKALDVTGNSIHGASTGVKGSVAVDMRVYAEIGRIKDNWIDRWETGLKLDGPDWGRLHVADNLYLDCLVPYVPDLKSVTGPNLQTQLVVEDGPIQNALRRPGYRFQAPTATVPVLTDSDLPVVNPLRGNHFLIQPKTPVAVRLEWEFTAAQTSKKEKAKRRSDFAGQRLILQFLKPALLSKDDFRLAKGLSVEVPEGALIDFVVDHTGEVREVGDATVAMPAIAGDELGNTAYGYEALEANTAGNLNAAFGYGALKRNTSGAENSGLGAFALQQNREGRHNTAVGHLAASENLSGSDNTAVGFLALHRNNRSSGNTAVGVGALDKCTGSENSALGRGALGANSDGDQNAALGVGALYDSAKSRRSTAVGYHSLVEAKGDYNVAIGYRALKKVVGKKNVALGSDAGALLEEGEQNLYLDSPGAAEESQAIRLGDIRRHQSLFAAGVHGVTPGGTPLEVVIDENGQVGTRSSSATVKDDIRELDAMGERLAALRPVSFRYKERDGSRPGGGRTHFGLIAEEVAESFPELVATDIDGRPHAVLYQELPTLLLAEIQRLRREVEALKEGPDVESQDL